MQLIYNGKESRNEHTVRDCSYHKGCVVRVLQKGRRGVAPVVEPEAKEHAAASSRARYGPLLRATVEGDKEFDGSDGWAVAEDIHVAEAQEWFRRSHKAMGMQKSNKVMMTEVIHILMGSKRFLLFLKNEFNLAPSTCI